MKSSSARLLASLLVLGLFNLVFLGLDGYAPGDVPVVLAWAFVQLVLVLFVARRYLATRREEVGRYGVH